MQRITSRQNAMVSAFRDAARGGADQPLLLDGIHLVTEALAAGIALHHVIVSADAVHSPEIAHLLSAIPTRTTTIASASGSVIDAISPVRSSSPIVALASRPARPGTAFSGDSPLVLVGCDIQDPGNVGAIVRVAEAAGASGVIVAGASADPFGWKALRGSMGSVLRVPVVTASVEDAIGDARSHGATIAAAVPRGGTPLFDSRLTGPTALFVGGEGAGLPADLVDAADIRISIPMEGPVESLNAAVAAAVLLYEAHRQRAASARSADHRVVSSRA